jgi:hypothetical protein
MDWHVGPLGSSAANMRSNWNPHLALQDLKVCEKQCWVRSGVFYSRHHDCVAIVNAYMSSNLSQDHLLRGRLNKSLISDGSPFPSLAIHHQALNKFTTQGAAVVMTAFG